MARCRPDGNPICVQLYNCEEPWSDTAGVTLMKPVQFPRNLVTAAPLPLGATMLLLACTGDPTGPAVGESFTLAPGNQVTLEVVNTRVRFLDVAEDSRCPLRAQCVWAGDGAVVLELASRPGGALEETLHTNADPKSVFLDRYELTLLKLEPYPEVPGEIRPEDYRVTLALHERRD